jgi:hypothetical protein
MKLAPQGQEIQELFCVPSEEQGFNSWSVILLPAKAGRRGSPFN